MTESVPTNRRLPKSVALYTGGTGKTEVLTYYNSITSRQPAFYEDGSERSSSMMNEVAVICVNP